MLVANSVGLIPVVAILVVAALIAYELNKE